MYVPNFIPEPIEVPDNVADQPHRVRLVFLRRVTGAYVGSIWAIALLAWQMPRDGVSPSLKLITLLGFFVVLDFVRWWLADHELESRIASVSLFPIVFFTAWLLKSITENGTVLWPILVGPNCALVYTHFCKRDYSFVGNFLISALGAVAITIAIGKSLALTTTSIGMGCILSIAFLGYMIYDLASLQSRRRADEILAATADLHRDVLNIVRYIPRVVRHWRKHKIWSLPRSTS